MIVWFQFPDIYHIVSAISSWTAGFLCLLTPHTHSTSVLLLIWPLTSCSSDLWFPVDLTSCWYDPWIPVDLTSCLSDLWPLVFLLLFSPPPVAVSLSQGTKTLLSPLNQHNTFQSWLFVLLLWEHQLGLVYYDRSSAPPACHRGIKQTHLKMFVRFFSLKPKVSVVHLLICLLFLLFYRSIMVWIISGVTLNSGW